MTLRLAVILFSTGLTSFLSTYLAASVNLALKTIGAEFHANAADLSQVASLYLLLTSLCLIPFGRLSDAYGPRRTLLFGCAFFILSNALVPLAAHDFTSLLVMRGLQGAAAAFLLVSNTPLVAAVFPAERRAMAMGFLSGMVFFGYSIGNFVGGLLTEHFGWRSIFVSAALAGAVAFVCIWTLVPEGKKRTPSNRGSLDLPGILFYALTLISLQFGAARLTSPDGPALLCLSVAGLLLFIRRQLQATSPIFDVRLFTGNRAFAYANVAVFCTFAATYGSQYLLPLYLQCNRGLSPSEAGQITLFQPLVQIFFSPLAGYLADRSSPAWVASMGLGILTIASALLVFIDTSTPFALIYVALILTGIGISFFSAPNTSIIMGVVPEEKRGIAAASNSIMRNLGMQFSIILCGLAFLLTLGQAEGIPAALYPEMLSATRACFGIFAVFCALGAIVSLRRG